ncbi:unnamed protein product [Mesocestoides corti]|uniref:Ubiquitin carboxyl-terminal hydrolase n=1 Tax=Mesocestoides corti TaxID=53468 RepID=A0A158QRY6_MESCO|nr:unnamed protein product [Mesocestoides corti]
MADPPPPETQQREPTEDLRALDSQESSSPEKPNPCTEEPSSLNALNKDRKPEVSIPSEEPIDPSAPSNADLGPVIQDFGNELHIVDTGVDEVDSHPLVEDNRTLFLRESGGLNLQANSAEPDPTPSSKPLAGASAVETLPLSSDEPPEPETQIPQTHLNKPDLTSQTSSTFPQSSGEPVTSTSPAGPDTTTSTLEQLREAPTSGQTSAANEKAQLPSEAASPVLEASSAAGAPETSPSKAAAKSAAKDASVHQVKWITFNGNKVPVITQNENGPCPMIAITNVLLLRRKLNLPPGNEVISSDLLIAALSDNLLSYSIADLDEGQRSNYEANLSAALSVFPYLQTGLDINVRFTGVSDFEYTPALTVFDLFRIPLFHGWVVDPQDRELAQTLKDQTYNQVVEMIINYKSSSDPSRIQQGYLIEEFLERTASQLTVHGLCKLSENLREHQLAILFRNNHFNTIYKSGGQVYVLVTDVGFMNEPNIVWETLDDVDGDSRFVDCDFRLCTKFTARSPPAAATTPSDVPPVSATASSHTTSPVCGSPEQIDMELVT